jgi:hypothetical protein
MIKANGETFNKVIIILIDFTFKNIFLMRWELFTWSSLLHIFGIGATFL